MTMVEQSLHELDFDGIDLNGYDYGGYSYTAQSKGASLGNPMPVDRELISQLLDGTYIETDRHNNRKPELQIRIDATDSNFLAIAEARLFLSCSRPAELGWQPPDGWGARTVYQAFTSHIEHSFDDVGELNLARVFRLELNASPFGYSDVEVVTVATGAAPVTPVTVVVNDGTSAAGWTSPSGATAQPVSSGGQIVVAPNHYIPPPYGAYQTYDCETTLTTAATDYTGTEFISLDVVPMPSMFFEGNAEAGYVSGEPVPKPQYGNGKYSGGSRGYDPGGFIYATMDGTRLPMVTYVLLADGVYRYTYRVTDASATTLRIRAFTRPDDLSPAPALVADRGFKVDNVSRSNVQPGQSSSGRMSMRTLRVQGSARTAPSIEIAHPTSSLAETLFYTSSALGGRGGYQPDLRKYLANQVAMVITTDATTLSGSRSRGVAGTDLHLFSAPATVFPPGAYLVMLRARAIDAVMVGKTLTVEVSQTAGGTQFGFQSIKTVDGLPDVNVWSKLMVVGVVNLPPQNVPDGSSATVDFRIDYPTIEYGDKYEVDDLFVFHLGQGSDLSHFEAGAVAPSIGQGHNYVKISSASPLRNYPEFYFSTQPDYSNAFDPGYPTTAGGIGILGRASHPLTPPFTRVFVATVGAAYPTITARYTPAWHTHAGPVEVEQ